MKNHFRFSILIVFLCLVLCITGCGNKTPVVIDTQPSVPETTIPPTTEAPNAADIYSAAAETLCAGSVGMEIQVSQSVTIAEQTFTSETTQTVSYWNPGGEDFFARVESTTDYGRYEYSLTELYSGGTVYQVLNDCQFSSAMEAADYLSRYPALELLNPNLYTLSQEGDTIRFTDATALESWLTGEDAVLEAAEAAATLDEEGSIQEIVYTARYAYGPAQHTVSYTVTYTDPGQQPALPDSANAYTAVTDIDGLALLDDAYGYLLQAEQYSVSILSSVQSQAAGLVVNNQTSVDTYLTASGTDYLVETSIYAMDQTDTYETSNTEKFIGGKYTSSVDDGEEVPNNAVTAALMEEYTGGLLSANIVDTLCFNGAEITDLGSLYLIEYTCTEDFALSLSEDFSETYLGQADLLQGLASSYQTNRLDYYLALDKYTMLPTACGYLYEGCHTIEDYGYLLIEQLDQSFDLASMTSHDAIYEEPSPDIVPAEKATPLFYHVTGDDGQEMWLFGTIHVGDDRTAFLPKEIYDALLSSDALAVECDTEGFDEAVEEDEDLKDQVSAYYFYDDGTIQDHLDTEDLYDDAVKVMKATGSYFYNTEYLKASTWSSSIDNYYLSQGHQLLSEKGLESRLEKLADENDIPLWEVESSLFQIQMLTGFSDHLQEFQLYSSVYSHGKDSWEDVAELYELWCEGDEAKLIEEMKREVWAFTDEDLEETEDMDEEDLKDLQYIRENKDSINAQLADIYEEYVKSMESDRNAGMLEVAKEYLESGDTVFVAVGLAHLIAEDGLVFALRDAGYTVELVEYK